MSESPDSDDEARFTKSLIAVVVALVIVIAGYFVLTETKRLSDIQDCLMYGRKHCPAADSGGD